MTAADKIQERLFALQDREYKEFQCRLLPTVPPERVIGVRVPALRRLARELSEDTEIYLSALPHTYYDENNLHSILLSRLKDYDETIAALDAFLPFVDNWATCDIISPKAFRKHPDGLPEQAGKWMASGHEFTVRFGIGVLMSFYLEEAFQPEYLEQVAGVQKGMYYVDMMAAWYFATALAKQYDAALPYLEQKRLPSWTHNKTIQKAIESYRVSDDQKKYLRTLKV